MRIVYVVPGLLTYGGIRIIIEHVNRLHDRGHEAFLAPMDRTLECSWLEVRAHIIHPMEADSQEWDVVVATSGGTWDIVSKEFKKAVRKYGFCQMKDHLFYHGDDRQIIEECYKAPITPIAISKWLVDWLHELGHERVEMIDNGVNFDHFYPEAFNTDYIDMNTPIVLIEGRDLDYTNEGAVHSEVKNTRDAHKVFDILVKKGYNLHKWGFSQDENETRWTWDQFWHLPPQDIIRKIYSTVGASGGFLLKTSQYEGRNCSVVEAYACKCPVVATDPQGNEDLRDRGTCFLSKYGDVGHLVADSMLMLNDKSLRDIIRSTAYKYVHRFLNWDDIIPTLERILET